MVPSSVVTRELCNLGYLGESIGSSESSSSVVGRGQASVGEDSLVLGVKPVIAQNPSRSTCCGSQSISSAVVVSYIVPVVHKSVQVLSIPFPELVSILKRVPVAYVGVREAHQRTTLACSYLGVLSS